MRKIKRFFLASLIVICTTTFAQVGIGELNPNSQLDIIYTGSAGNAIEATYIRLQIDLLYGLETMV